jgi:hypothetical protein
MRLAAVLFCALAGSVAGGACRGASPAAPNAAPAPAPTAAAPAVIDPWQVCRGDADCAVVTVDRGACDLCQDTWGVARDRVDDVGTQYRLTEAVDVCADRDHTCADATAVCQAGACALRATPWAGGPVRVVMHALPAR